MGLKIPGINLKSMRRPKRKSRDGAEVAFDEDPFPFGLMLRFDDETLKKLGMTEMPEVGSKQVVYAVGEITEVSERETNRPNAVKRGDAVNRNVELQITDLQVMPKQQAENKGKAKVKSRFERTMERRGR